MYQGIIYSNQYFYKKIGTNIFTYSTCSTMQTLIVKLIRIIKLLQLPDHSDFIYILYITTSIRGIHIFVFYFVSCMYMNIIISRCDLVILAMWLTVL